MSLSLGVSFAQLTYFLEASLAFSFLLFLDPFAIFPVFRYGNKKH